MWGRAFLEKGVCMHFSSVAFPRAELRSERQGAYKSCILRGLRPICPRMHAHARPAQDLAEEPAHTQPAEPLDGRLAADQWVLDVGLAEEWAVAT